MTPEFFTVHKDLPREGPGEPADVHWALSVAQPPADARVLDAGCGPGADTETLAAALPGARITGVDGIAQFIEAARARCARFGSRVRLHQGDMATPDGPYDLIWCAGALYFLGVTQGLAGWRKALAPGASVAFSEPVRLDGPQPEAVAEFWAQYPALTDMAGIRARVAAAGYAVQGERLILGAPWENYYGPMQARLDRLRASGPDEALQAAMDAEQREIDLWRSAPRHIGYAQLVVAPRDA